MLNDHASPWFNFELIIYICGLMFVARHNDSAIAEVTPWSDGELASII